MLMCKWRNCGREFTEKKYLVDHVTSSHIEQRKGCDDFPCFWEVSSHNRQSITEDFYKTVNILSLCSCSAKSVCRTISIQNFHLQIVNVNKSDSSLVTETQLPTIIAPGVSTTIEAVQREVQAAHPHEGSHWREALRLQGESNPSFFITDK